MKNNISPKSQSKSTWYKDTGYLPALKIAVIYCVFSGLWIVFSDQAIEAIALDKAVLSSIQTMKGLFFVVITALLLFTLIHRSHKSQNRLVYELRESETRFRNLFENSEISIWNEDLSEVYRALEKLRHDNVSDLRRYLNDNNQAVWEIAAMVKVLHVNEVTLKLFGAKSEEELIHKIDKTFGPDAIEVFIDELCAIWEGKRDFRAEVCFRTLDGRDLTAIIAFRMPETEDDFKSVPVSILDISEHRQTEVALRRAQKMDAIGQMAGGIAHDFNNILSIILGNLSFLKRQIAGDEKAVERVANADKAALRAADLTKQLLGFSRKQAEETLPTNINRVIQDMDSLISRSITPAVEVEHHLADDLWLTEIDSGDFEDALLNMILNARDAMPEGGRLTIETSNKVLNVDYSRRNPTVVPGEYVELAVNDTGTGISEDELDRVFEPFFTTKPQGKGTGLGMSMVFGFTQRSKGHVKIYSEPGIGTTIRCYLPRSDSLTVEQNLSLKEESRLPRGEETILVVDDEEDLLELAQQYLEELGYSVVTAKSAQRALAILAEKSSIDLLFSDVVMPGGMNGYELAEQAVSNDSGLKVLLSSGYSSRSLYRNGQARFKANLLTKPYNQNDMARRVRLVLDE